MIRGWLVGDKEMIARFERFGPEVQSALKDGVGRLALQLLRHVVKDKLTDGVLRIQTGRLSRSINQKVEADGARVYGIVGTNVKYAARHEFGFAGAETVKAHMRMMKQAFGRPVKNPRQIMVGSFSRNVNYPAHSFLRSALEDMRPEITEGLQRSIDSSISKVFKK